jgi:GntR family transcriptional regulator/MocR family aminotransferase
LTDLLETWDTEAGMHTMAWLPVGVEDTRVVAAAAAAGLNVAPVSEFAMRPLSRGGLLLGYAAFTPAAIRKGVRELGTVLKKCTESARTARAAD